MADVRVKMAAGGRVVVPVEFRRELRLKDGDDLVLRLEGRELRMFSLEQAIRRSQEIVRQYVPKGVSLADELIAERRAEAKRG